MDELIEAIRDKNAILFVGAGASQMLGLPSHMSLIDALADELGYDPDVFRTLGDHLSLAEYYLHEKDSLGDLRSRLDVDWHSPDIDLGSSRLHQLIVELEFPLVYTTNYDRWIERSYERFGRDYRKVVGVADLRGLSDGVPQIVKFHGDFGHDESIVLTEESYFRRLDFESPLDIKFRADALGKSILFLGYSLSDMNVRYMLYRLQHAWAAAPSKQPSSYILLTRPNPIQEVVLKRRGVTALFTTGTDGYRGTVAFLEGLLSAAHGRTAPPTW